MNKYNVVALGNRDYYQVAKALEEKKCFNKLLTDFYTPDICRKIINKRWEESIKSSKTVSLILFMKFFNLIHLVFKFKPLNYKQSDFIFGFFSALYTYMTTNRAIVYSYYIEGFHFFYKIFKLKPKEFIVFQVHPTPWHINEILEKDQKQHYANGGGKFQQEIESNYVVEDYEKYNEALASASKVICASNFTAVSLNSFKKISAKIGIAPYGSKFTANKSVLEKSLNKSIPKKIRLLTVAQLIQRKGLHHAFDAMKGLEEYFEWVIVSSKPDPELLKYIPSNVTIKSGISESDLEKEYYIADLFVLPSLIEGFGLVYIESMSVGTPVLCSQNTGAADLIQNEKEGFIVSPGSVDSIKYIFEQLIHNPKILEMSESCIRKANLITWENFRKKISDFIVD